MAQPARKRTERTVAKRAPNRNNLSGKDAAKKLASMIAQHMTDLGLPEEKRNRRVAKFGERVSRAIASHAKS
jgi:hypothetical protein